MHRLSTYLVIGLCLVQVFACQKQIEKTTEDSLEFSTSSEAAIVSEFAYCKLRTVSHELSSPPGTPNLEIKGTFVYHPDGLPDNLTYSNSGTGNPNYYFIYDNKRRLRELRVGYSKNEAGDVAWHRYGYNSANQIVVDTLVNFLSFDPASAIVRIVSTLTYDAQGRISSESAAWYSGGVVEQVKIHTYSYDAKGNLVVAGWPSSSYDNNISIFRSHPLFQFIHRNYSKNNAAPQAKYNTMGLPLSNAPSNHVFFNAYPTTVGRSGIVKATYDCDAAISPNEFLNCKLRLVVHDAMTGTFVYHPDGMPDRLVYEGGGTGNPNYYFLYDNKRRLRELREGYSKNSLMEAVCHRYGYNVLNQIVGDTLYNPLGVTQQGEFILGAPRMIATLAYDGMGRIKTESQVWFSGGTPNFTNDFIYNYDTRGNLIVEGWNSSSYDNKVSIYRAHNLFQFLHRNYSRNNSAAQSKYNSKGLPLSNKPGNSRFFNAEPTSVGGGITRINYDCP